MDRPNDSSDTWIPCDEYQQIQQRVPILCVDLLLLGPSADAVGLIRRATYAGNEGWCLIGGAVGRNEALLSALARHVEDTLGPAVSYDLASLDPLAIAEYFTEPLAGQLHDPRKHAVALSYVGTLTGEPHVGGEATAFRWFGRSELETVDFGFDQGRVVSRLLSRLD
jgi:ADP-ribose pyrophosphatase YjhB (NUDIX family)